MGLAESTGFPGWVLIILAFFAVAWLATASFLVYRRCQIYNHVINEARAGVVICTGDEAREDLERAIFSTASAATAVAISPAPAPNASDTDAQASVVIIPTRSVQLLPTASTTPVTVDDVAVAPETVAEPHVTVIPARPIAFPSADPIASRYLGRIKPDKILAREKKRRAADCAVLCRTGNLPPLEIESGGAPTPLDGNELYAAAVMNPYQGSDVARGALIEEPFTSDDDDDDDDATATTAADAPPQRADTQAAARSFPSAYPHPHRCRHRPETDLINGEPSTFHSCGEGCVYVYSRVVIDSATAEQTSGEQRGPL